MSNEQWSNEESNRTKRLETHRFGKVSWFPWASLVFLLVQTPIYVFWFPIHVIWSLYNALFSMRDATSSDVMDFIFESSLVMLVRKVDKKLHSAKNLKSSGNPMHVVMDTVNCDIFDRMHYTMDIPDCKLIFKDRQGCPFHLRSWSIVFSMTHAADYKHAIIEQFLVNGHEIKGIHEMISVIAVYFTLSLHTKTHITAETLHQKIERQGIQALYPSLFITRALHVTLFHSFASPITCTLFNSFIPSQLNVDKNSLFQEEANNCNSMSHTGIHLFRHTVPFVQFLWKARESCLRHTKPVGLDTIYGNTFF